VVPSGGIVVASSQECRYIGRGICTNNGRIAIAKNQNTFAKRLREMEKKRKADQKRVDRRKRKDQPAEPVVQDPLPEDAPA
jgi:hypothetical protein